MPPRSNGYIPPCIPTRAYKLPAGPDWVHEIKHDGYRLIVRRDGEAIRLFTLYSLAASRPVPGDEHRRRE
jgi:ATP-dependent DNA ligase